MGPNHFLRPRVHSGAQAAFESTEESANSRKLELGSLFLFSFCFLLALKPDAAQMYSALFSEVDDPVFFLDLYFGGVGKSMITLFQVLSAKGFMLEGSMRDL